MSIEYTIDIQLTELGFPEILQPREPAEARTASATPHAISSSIKSLSVQHKRGDHTGSRGTEAGEARRTSLRAGASAPGPLSQVSQCEQVEPAPSPQEGHAANKPVVNDAAAGGEATNTGEEKDGQAVANERSAEPRDVDDQSGDGEVSDVNEEEEFDVDEEEEDLSSESSHPGDYSCSVCHLQLPSRFKLQDHMNLHTGARPYCCAECGKRFCQTSSYRVHLRSHALAKVKQHQCRVCLKRFASERDLVDHFSETHLEETFYECDLCKRVFTSMQDCEKHIQLLECLTKYACGVCDIKFLSRKMLEIHRKKFFHGGFKCTDCSEAFTKKNALLKHSFSHLGLLPYTCIRCHQHFRLARLYFQHKCEPERIHCVACLREFSSHKDFQQHKEDTGCWGVQEHNAKATEIRCLECGQRFSTTEELKEHAGAHQRVLKCAECWKGFRSSLLLMSHMGGHAGTSPCLCQTCGLGFPYQQNYVSHLKTCGQALPPLSATKKHQTSKSSSLETKTKNSSAKSESPYVVSAVIAPTADLNKAPDPKRPTTVLKKRPHREEAAERVEKVFSNTEPVCVASAAPQTGGSSPAPLIAAVPASSASSERFWKLTLDNPPPPSVDLVMILPVCPPPTSELLLTSAIPPTLPLAAIPAQCQTSVLAVSTNGYFGVKPTVATQPNTPMELSRGDQEALETPLDLSLKRIEKQQPTKFPDCCVKSEQVQKEISKKADVSFQNFQYHAGQTLVETNGNGRAEVKKWKIEPIVPFQMNVETASHQRVGDTVQEAECSVECSSEANKPAEWIPEKKIKMEGDI